VLFEGFALPIFHNKVCESLLAKTADGRSWLLYSDSKLRLVRKLSTDEGRTWGEPQLLSGTGGTFFNLSGNNAHPSLLQLKSGALGIVYDGPSSRPGRDGTLLFRRSKNGGESWSAPVVIDPVFSVCRVGSVRVLESGRIVAPAFKWISPQGGPSAEATENSLTFSWVFYSDDEGQTWHRSLSEAFVSIDHGQVGCYDFEEPSLVERKDGSLLMFGRTELGRFYQTVSKDRGVSWSDPSPAPLAASYAPPYLVRIPSTDDILTVWNQASTEEIVAGLARHRLSTAISSDGGTTWQHFRNLESLDDRTYVEPPPANPARVYRRAWPYQGLADQHRYPHPQQCQRICYPTVTFGPKEVTFAYDYGFGGPGALKEGSTTKIKVVSRDWLYERSA
jgi:hypothetical protein